MFASSIVPLVGCRAPVRSLPSVSAPTLAQAQEPPRRATVEAVPTYSGIEPTELNANNGVIRRVVETQTQPSVWTLADAETVALKSHPALQKRRAVMQSALGQYVQAGLPFNPIAQYQSEEIGNEKSTGLHSVTISQQFVTANKLGIAEQVRGREYKKQQARLRIEELRIAADVRTSFALGLVAQKRVDLTKTIFQLAQKSEAAVRDLVNAEEASRLVLLQAQVETEQAQIEFENSRAQHRAAIRILAAAVGDPTISVGQLSGELLDPVSHHPWERMLDQIVATSPEIAFAGSELERAGWALRLARAKVVPNVTGQAGVGYDASTDDTFAAVGVSVPLPIRNRNQGNIQSARADIAAATAALDETRLSLEGRLADSVGRYEIARERYQRLTESVIPAAEEAYALAAKAFEVGEVDYLQLLTAQRTLFEKKLRVLTALGQATKTANEIDTLLVGLPL